VDEGEKAIGAIRAKPRRDRLRRTLLSRLSLEASWIDDSWREWEKRLEAWIAKNKPTPEDDAALRNWFNDAEHYDWLWRRYRVYHRLLRVTLIVLGVVTPLLVQAGAMTLATVSGGIVAAAAGLDGFFNWGERVQLQRRVAECLKDEGVAFLTGQEPYERGDAGSLKEFKGQLANITREHRRDYDAARGELGGPKAPS
jgi:Protein of unknown function (DUF4231)